MTESDRQHGADDGPIGDARFIFPPWANYLLPALVVIAVGALTYLPFLYAVGTSPENTEVGYQPQQPIPFSHQVHAGDLKIDCRYCHSTVEQAPFAAIPPTQTCLNCHAAIRSESPLLEPMRHSFETGTPLSWIKVHDLPDFVYFNHSAHVNQGIGCVTCHGRVDQMEVVYQSQPITMRWCLECHRAPEKHLRPRDQVTNMEWQVSADRPSFDDRSGIGGATFGSSAQQRIEQELHRLQHALGSQLRDVHRIPSREFMTSCTTCHR